MVFAPFYPTVLEPDFDLDTAENTRILYLIIVDLNIFVNVFVIPVPRSVGVCAPDRGVPDRPCTAGARTPIPIVPVARE